MNNSRNYRRRNRKDWEGGSGMQLASTSLKNCTLGHMKDEKTHKASSEQRGFGSRTLQFRRGIYLFKVVNQKRFSDKGLQPPSVHEG